MVVGGQSGQLPPLLDRSALKSTPFTELTTAIEEAGPSVANLINLEQNLREDDVDEKIDSVVRSFVGSDHQRLIALLIAFWDTVPNMGWDWWAPAEESGIAYSKAGIYSESKAPDGTGDVEGIVLVIWEEADNEEEIIDESVLVVNLSGFEEVHCRLADTAGGPNVDEISDILFQIMFFKEVYYKAERQSE